MTNLLCLETKNNMVTKEQVFVSTLTMMVKSNLMSIRKWHVIAPIDYTKARYHQLIKYQSSLDEAYIENFISKNGLTIAQNILVNDKSKNFEDVLKLKEFICDILLKTYMLPEIPDYIIAPNVYKYIEMMENSIKENIILYYKDIADKLI